MSDSANPSADRFLAPIAAAVTLLLGFFLCFTPVPVYDLWWQMKAGEVIAQSGRVPHHDLFGWPSSGAPWIVHEWLSGLLLYTAYQRLPHWVLALYKTGMAVIILAIAMAHAARRARSLWPAMAVTLLAAYGLRWFVDIRPQMITFALVVAMLSGLDQWRAGRATWFPRALPAVFLVWANLHAGVMVGAGILGLWLLGEAAERWYRRGDLGSLRPLALGAAGAFLAILVNPAGYHLYLYPFRVLREPHVMEFIREWLSPDFHSRWHLPFEVALLGTFTLLAAARERRASDILLLVALAHLALLAVRNTPLFVLVAAPVLAESGAGAARRLAHRLGLDAGPSWLFLPAACAATLGLVVMAWRAAPRDPPSAWFDRLAVSSSFPHEAADQLAAGRWPGRFYNDYNWGGYLAWRLYPRRKVFIDGRAEVYYGSSFQDTRRLHYVEPGWEEILNRWQIVTVLTQRGGALAHELDRDPHWACEHSDSLAKVYRRR